MHSLSDSLDSAIGHDSKIPTLNLFAITFLNDSLNKAWRSYWLGK